MTTQVAARAYTLAEIDEVRTLTRFTFSSDSYETNELRCSVEDRLRTYMMGGVGVEELKKAVKEAAIERKKAHMEALARQEERLRKNGLLGEKHDQS